MYCKKNLNILFVHYAVKDKQGFGRTFMLAKELAKLENKVTFLTSQPANEFIFPFKKEMKEGVLIISFPDIVPDFFRRTGFGLLATLFKTIYAIFHKYDIVHSDNGHRPSAGLPCLFNRWLRHSKYITEWWDYFGKGGQYDKKKIIKKMTHGIYDLLTEMQSKKIADGIVVLSEFTKKRALDNSIIESKVIKINGGSDIDKIKYYSNNEKNKKQFGIPTDSISFFFIGMNKDEFYDIIPFIEAVNELKNRIRINLITTGAILSKDIKNKYFIGSELIEFGWLDYHEYSEVISCADIFLLVQRDEIINLARWPNKIGDYFAAGRLILTNPVGEVKELLKKYRNSFVVVKPCKDNIIEKILELNKIKNKLCSLGEINREIAIKELSWKIQARKLNDFYKKMLTQ